MGKTDESKELWGVRAFKTIGWIDQSSLTGCAEIPPMYFVVTAGFASAVLT